MGGKVMTDDHSHTFETRTIHAAQDPDPQTGAVMPGVQLSSTFAQDAPGETRGFEYARTGNPTRATAEDHLANLEEGAYGRMFASGMAAIDAIGSLLDPGDHVLVGQDVYGGTARLFDQVYATRDVGFTYVDTTDVGTVSNAVSADTALIWLETPTNPLLQVADIGAIAEIAHAEDAILAVDNTFATPYLQRPLAHGADVVVHSLTKYLGGHSDLVAGAVLTNDALLDERIGFYQNAVGATPDPLTSFLVLRGTKTLAVRMDRHCSNAGTIAEWLTDHPRVDRVHYPGLESHPNHSIARTQMDGFGGMVSFELDGSLAAAEAVVSSTEVFTLAESLGGVESLVEQPATMTHASIPAERRRDIGIADGLIRLSVGIEAVEDLKADLDQAIERAFA